MDSKVAIYCRVSSSMQSSDRQKSDLLELAGEMNYSVSENHVYQDVITGFSLAEDRPQYSAMLAEIDNGKIDTILFSELTRLGRNSTELLSEIQRLQNSGVKMYFQKQDIWAKSEKKDLGSKILLAVLAVTSSYEIELFAERSLSGKINKIQKGGGVIADSRTYGYMNDEFKKMKVNDDEAKVVRDIFNWYANGLSILQICDKLNLELHVPSPFSNLLQYYIDNRKKKGLAEKEYQHIDVDNLKWRPSTISRMLSNEIYIGHRVVVFHKPILDKVNVKGKKDKEPRDVLYEYDVRLDDLRIVSDEVFQAVKERLGKAKYNKNNAMKHENLLKSKLVCGECGSNFSVGKQADNAKRYTINPRSYKCYGRVNRPEHPRICKEGAEILQWRLDGLVLQLSLWMFAEINISATNEQRIEQLTKEIEEHERIRQEKELELTNLHDDFKKTVSILTKTKGKTNSVIIEMIDEATDVYENKKKTCTASLSKLNKEIASKRNLIKRLKVLTESFANLNAKMNEIRSSKELVKDMVEEYIDKIEVFKIHKLWNLIIVKYVSGDEMWGTIKNARYKNNEMFYDEMVCHYGVEFKAWMLNNSDHCFKYDKDKHTVSYNGKSEMYSKIPVGTYTYDELDKILDENELIGSFPFYAFEESPSGASLKSKSSETSISNNIDWQKHNDEILNTKGRKTLELFTGPIDE